MSCRLTFSPACSPPTHVSSTSTSPRKGSRAAFTIARRRQQQKNRSQRRETRERCRRNCCAPRQIPGVEARGEGQCGLRKTTGGDRDRKPRQIDARGDNWVYNAGHLGLQKGNPFAALNPRQFGKTHRRQAKVSNRTREIRLSGIIGGLGKRDHS